jgi:hypothetical protein
LRSVTPKEDQPGQGKRWGFKGTKKEIEYYRKKFENWNVPRMTEAEGPGADVVDDEELGEQAIQEEEDLLGGYEPTEEDLLDIEFEGE